MIAPSSFSSLVSWPVLTSALAYMPTRHPRFDLAHQEPSRYEALVGETLASGSADETVEPLERVHLHVAIVQPECEFVDVAPKVLRAYLMVYAMNAALHDSPNAFDAVGCDRAACVFFGGMADGLMRVHGSESNEVPVLVSVEGRAEVHRAHDFALHTLLIGALHEDCLGAPATLAHSVDGRFTRAAGSGMQFLSLVLVTFLAADEGLINFDDALQVSEVVSASFAQALQHKPRGLLRDPDFLRQLHGRDALARGDEQVHCVNPLVQRNVRALEDRTGANREIFLALIAAIVAALANGFGHPVRSTGTLAPSAKDGLQDICAPTPGPETSGTVEGCLRSGGRSFVSSVDG